MDREGLVQVDGAALSRCLFLIWQAWAKRTGGDEAGALDCLDGAILTVAPGVVEMILHLIELGELPAPAPDTTDEWFSRCREALSGEFIVITAELGPSADLEARPAPRPSAPPPVEPSGSLMDDMAAMGWL
jgi:hypothetical protein